MKRFYILGLVFFFANTYSQTKCDTKDFEREMGVLKSEYEKKEKENKLNYDRAMTELSRIKKWTDKQRTNFEISLIEKTKGIEKEEKKKSYITEMMEIIITANEKEATEKNCLVIKQVLEKMNLAFSINNESWNDFFNLIKLEYKKTTNKDLVLE